MNSVFEFLAMNEAETVRGSKQKRPNCFKARSVKAHL